jgi:hypothetical protein
MICVINGGEKLWKMRRSIGMKKGFPAFPRSGWKRSLFPHETVLE